MQTCGGCSRCPAHAHVTIRRSSLRLPHQLAAKICTDAQSNARNVSACLLQVCALIGGCNGVISTVSNASPHLGGPSAVV